MVLSMVLLASCSSVSHTSYGEVLGVLCDRRMPIKVKGKFKRRIIKPAMLYGSECSAAKFLHIHKIECCRYADDKMDAWL